VEEKKMFTNIYLVLGMFTWLWMLFIGYRLLMAEIQSKERVWPWIIGLLASCITATMVHVSSKTTK
jgi:hypothetical protein